MLEKSKALVDEIEDAYKELEADHKPLSLRKSYAEFARALIEYRDSVLYDLVTASTAASGDSSNKIGRSTEWGSKRSWKKSAPSVGESSKMTVMSEEGGGIEQRFEDEPDERVHIAGETSTFPEEPLPEAPKKKKVVKRVVRRIKKQEVDGPKPTTTEVSRRTTKEGGKLTDKDLSVLRSTLYYISERDTESSAALQADIRSSMDSLLAKTSVVGTIVDSATRDEEQLSKDASTSLGLNDGTIAEDCILPVLLDKLTSA